MELKQEQKAEMEERLRRLKEHYSSVFEDGLGKIVGMKARLTLKPEVCKGKTCPIHNET